MTQEKVPGIDERVVPRGGFDPEQLQHAEQQGAVHCMGSPEQRQVVVLMVGGDGLDVGAQGIDTTLIIEDPPDPASQDVVAAITLGLMQDLAEHIDQRLLHLPVLFLQKA